MLADMAENDPKTLVRARAIEALGKYKKDSYKPLFLKSINDSSYSVAGSSLNALGAIDTALALEKAKFSPVSMLRERSQMQVPIFYSLMPVKMILTPWLHDLIIYLSETRSS